MVGDGAGLFVGDVVEGGLEKRDLLRFRHRVEDADLQFHGLERCYALAGCLRTLEEMPVDTLRGLEPCTLHGESAHGERRDDRVTRTRVPA